MRLRQRFAARGDDGAEYEICVWVSEREVTPIDETHERSTIDRLPHLKTSTGLTVNGLEKRRYQSFRRE